MTIFAEFFYEKKYDVSQEKNMGGITLLYFNDDRPYRKTGFRMWEENAEKTEY